MPPLQGPVRLRDSLPGGEYGRGLLVSGYSLHQCLQRPPSAQFSDLAASLGLSVLCWREVPTDSACLGAVARASEPKLIQVK